MKKKKCCAGEEIFMAMLCITLVGALLYMSRNKYLEPGECFVTNGANSPGKILEVYGSDRYKALLMVSDKFEEGFYEIDYHKKVDCRILDDYLKFYEIK